MPFAATMRPRSMGTRSRVERGACARTKAVEAFGIGRWNVQEEERGRLFRQPGGELAMQIAVDLDQGDQQAKTKAEREHYARRQRSGRWILAMASRSSVDRGRGSRRATAITSMATRRSATKMSCGGGEEHRREAAVVGEQNRQRRQRGDDRYGGDDVAAPRPAPLGGDLVAEQHRHRNVVGPSERPQGKGQSREQAVGDRKDERARDRGRARRAAE